MLLTNGAQSQDPGIHALVIGVGSYANAGGYGLDADLSSASVSAFEFAQFLLSDLRYPSHPWKSADVVISRAGDLSPAKEQEIRHGLARFGAWNFEPATFDVVSAAIKAWKVRCDASPDDIAMFYFCGHGVEYRGVIALLLENFDADAHGYFDGSVDLHGMHAATAAMKARDKFFFVDTCREAPWQVQELTEIEPPSVLPRVDKSHAELAPIYLATRESARAFGKPNECAQFTSSILASLRGAGARRGTGDHQGKWVVLTDSITSGIAEVLRLKVKFKKGKKQEAGLAGVNPLRREVVHVLDRAQLPAQIEWPAGVQTVVLKDGTTELWRTAGSSPWVEFDLDTPPPLPATLIQAFPEPDTDVDPKPYSCGPVDPPVIRYRIEWS